MEMNGGRWLLNYSKRSVTSLGPALASIAFLEVVAAGLAEAGLLGLALAPGSGRVAPSGSC